MSISLRMGESLGPQVHTNSKFSFGKVFGTINPDRFKLPSIHWTLYWCMRLYIAGILEIVCAHEIISSGASGRDSQLIRVARIGKTLELCACYVKKHSAPKYCMQNFTHSLNSLYPLLFPISSRLRLTIFLFALRTPSARGDSVNPLPFRLPSLWQTVYSALRLSNVKPHLRPC